MAELLDAISFLAIVYILVYQALKLRRLTRRVEELQSLLEVLLKRIRHDM